MSGTRVRNDGGVGLLRLRRYADRFRQSLFFLPALFVLGSILLGLGTVELDRGFRAGDLPSYLSTTVDNARSILSTVAGGTIGAASVVFSLTLVAVQLASSQFSPRVVRGFLGDRFQQVVMGIVVGTFTYSLVVLRVVQKPLEASNADPFLPQTSIVVAVVLAVASLLGVLASIDHTAKSLRVGALLDRVTTETLAVVKARFTHLDDDDDTETIQTGAPAVVPASPRLRSGSGSTMGEDTVPDSALFINAHRSGWVTQISIEGILAAIPEGSTILLESAVGSYLIPDSRLAAVWPVPEDERDRVEEALRDVVEVRTARTLQQDVSFGILQLTDIALRALSPGINDPNTANEAIVRIGTVLSVLLQRKLESSQLSSEGRTVVRSRELTAHDYVDAAVEPIRRYARAEPVVLQALVRTLATVRATVLDQVAAPIQLDSIQYQLDMIAVSVDALATEEERNRVRQALLEAGTPNRN